MSRRLFNRIAAAVTQNDPYFVQKRNAAGKLGFSSLQKIIAAFRQLAYGVPQIMLMNMCGLVKALLLRA